MNLNAEQLAAVDRLLLAGNNIAAIREFRGFTGAELVDAYAFVEDRLRQLRDSQPSRFSKTPRPPRPDKRILSKIKRLPNRDLRRFRSTLERIDKSLYGLNYAPMLAVDGATIPKGDLPVNELMLALFPDSKPHMATILPVDRQHFVAEVTDCLTYAGDQSAGPQFTDSRLRQLTEELLPEYWQELDALVPLTSASIHSYSSDVGLPGYYVFWFFAYLIHCTDTARCLVITGMASD